MPTFFSSVLHSLTGRLRQWRRAANLRAGQRGQRGQRGHAARVVPLRPARSWWWRSVPLLRRTSVLAGLALMLVGGGLLALHARQLVRSTASSPQAANGLRAAQVFQGVLPGVQFEVPQAAGISLSLHPDAALLVLAGMQAAPAVRIDLCSQLRGAAAGTVGAAPAQLVPLRLGYRFEDVQRWVRQNEAASVQIALRNVLLVAEHGAAAGMPQVQMSGVARGDFNDPYSEPLQLSWQAQNAKVRWLSDASFGQIEQGAQGRVALRQQGWLMWGEQAALRIERRNNVTCPQAGELMLQLYRPVAAAMPLPALVTAFPARGRPLSTLLASGRYQVPANPAPMMEDETLFAALQAQGMVSLNAQGAIELAPRDLPQWQALPPEQRVALGQADAWKAVAPGAVTQKLIKRLYYQADGAYVRQQVDLFNSERWLLAWRVPASAGATQTWQATSAPQDGAHASTASQAGTLATAVPLPSTGQMPLAASRLFAALPQGWQGWSRMARWPQAVRASAVPVRLQLALPGAAQGGEALQLMLLGRVVQVHGATARMAPVCSGRACRSPADVQHLILSLNPGVRAVQIDVAPLAFHSPEDQKYRHLWLDQGRIRWQALPLAAPASARSNPAGQSAALSTTLQLTDRHATPLWRDGSATPAALQAGLGPLVGLGSDHASSVSGMLARLPQLPQVARLTLDLPLQQLSQQVLDCVGLRRGRWEGGACVAAQTVPEGRHAGLVILDAETGDILAAAGAGTGAVNPANWAEVRDFDRTSPARSPLRLPAWQHDGGAHQSPGSTFKVVSALGLELAAQHDPQIDALLAGMPLAAINRLAQQRGFGFQTDAASYPLNPRLAHITNFREQSLDRRAQDGRLGLSQALTYSLNTWFAWSGELSDRSLFGRAEGGAPDLQALDADALDAVRPIVAAAHRLGFEQPLRLDGGLLPADFDWRSWDALQATPAHIDPIHTRHELRQMSIGLRMQVTPLQMALASAAIGQGSVVTPRLLLALDGTTSSVARQAPIGIRLDRIRAGMKGVVDVGTGAGAFRAAALAPLRRGLYGKTGTAPSGEHSATVWFTGWLEPGSLPGQQHRLAMAVFVSHSEATGGEHAAPVLASLLTALAGQPVAQKPEQSQK